MSQNFIAAVPYKITFVVEYTTLQKCVFHFQTLCQTVYEKFGGLADRRGKPYVNCMMMMMMIQYTEKDNNKITPTAFYNNILFHLLVDAQNGGILNYSIT
jgi:hypothetical protein